MVWEGGATQTVRGSTAEWGDVLTSEREMEGDVQFGKMKT